MAPVIESFAPLGNIDKGSGPVSLDDRPLGFSALSDYITLDAQVDPMVWGRSTYTILRIPAQVPRQLGSSRRVEGEINDHPVNLALTRAPVFEDTCLYAGKSLLQKAGIEPGQWIEVRLRPANSDLVAVAQDVTQAIFAANLTEQWQTLTPGKQRGLLHGVETAKTPATRSKRITALLITLSNG